MSSSPPPSYYRATTVSEKPGTISEKPSTESKKSSGSKTYHLTILMRKKCVLDSSGLLAPKDTIDDRDATITIPDNATWDQVRKELWRLYQKAWPAIFGDAKLEDYGLAVDMQYTAQKGGVYGRVSMLEFDGDAFWEFRKRDDINVISFNAYCAPLEGEVPGKVRSPSFVSRCLEINEKKLRNNSKAKKTSKRPHHCILQ
ncbi:hypothetical protein KCU65_g7274, partial [Aureobasidium melanogenum]